jgi:nifR3 family TIM-barrel protein
MSGISDPALRLICKEMGAGLVVTDLKSVNAISSQGMKLIEFSERERPIAVQLFGSDLEALKKAVKIVSPHFDIIDYNLGCPALKVMKQKAGAVLLDEPEMVRKILKVLMKFSSKPISIKIRAGVNKPDRFLEIGRIAEEEGAAMITFHPRTLKQGYSGKADWSLIGKLKKAVGIPIVGNGDICCPEDAERMIKETGCDYVMIGREAARNPFIFKQIKEYFATGKYSYENKEEKMKCFLHYLRYAEKHESIRFEEMRMQAMNFSHGSEGGKKFREEISRIKEIEELKKKVKEWIEQKK